LNVGVLSQISPRVRVVLLTLFVVFILDQATKLAIIKLIPVGSIDCTGREQEFFHFSHERNEGLVGGYFRSHDWIPKVFPVFATFVLIYLYRYLNPVSMLQNVAYGMVAGGAAGNLFDRFFRTGVVDFLQFHFYFIPFDFPWKDYPAFNIADSCICVGVVLLIIGWRKIEEPRTDVANPA
jgi:signal peptidase II